MEFLRSGKVKDVYEYGDHLVFKFSNRISVFDKIIPNVVPDKGASLCRTASYWFTQVEKEQGYDTVEANVKLGLPIDNRDYDFAKDVITFFGIESIALMSNNPSKFKYLEEHGIKIQSRIPIVVEATPFDRVYLDTKREKLGHQI